MTNYTKRVLLIVPAANQKALNAWIAANLDPTGGDWLTVPLNASGNATDPPTHYWCSAALDSASYAKLITQLGQPQNFAVNATWSDNRGTWGDAQVTAQTNGLRPKRSTQAQSKGA